MEPLGLQKSRCNHLFTHLATARSRLTGGQLLKWDRGHFQMNVDTVEQRTADFCHVFFDLRNAAMAWATWIIAVSTGTRIQGRNQDEVGGKRRTVQGPRNRHLPVLERLSQNFQ